MGFTQRLLTIACVQHKLFPLEQSCIFQFVLCLKAKSRGKSRMQLLSLKLPALHKGLRREASAQCLRLSGLSVTPHCLCVCVCRTGVRETKRLFNAPHQLCIFCMCANKWVFTWNVSIHTMFILIVSQTPLPVGKYYIQWYFLWNVPCWRVQFTKAAQMNVSGMKQSVHIFFYKPLSLKDASPQ